MLIFLPAAMNLHAQDDPEYRMEIGAGAGLSGYLGDFNSNLVKNLQPMATILGRYILNPYMALRMNVSYGKMKGSSKGIKTYYPAYASTPYEFNNAIYDVCFGYEYNFWPYGTGNDYYGAKRLTPFVFVGVGGTYISGAEKVFTANVPLGLGFKYKIGERMNVGLDWAMHFSLSDKLDGRKDPYGIASTGIFKNTDCYSVLQLTLTYSFMPKCSTCNKD